MVQASAKSKASEIVIASEYASSPVEQAADHIRSVRGFSQNFFTCSSGRTFLSSASYTWGYRKNDVSWVSNRSSSASYSILDAFTNRTRSAPRGSFLWSRCSRTRVEKNRSRDWSNNMPVRFSMSAAISASSCSLRFGSSSNLATTDMLTRQKLESKTLKFWTAVTAWTPARCHQL